jgi:hypothetical protein
MVTCLERLTKTMKDLRGAAGNAIEFRTESLPNGNLYRTHINNLLGTQKSLGEFPPVVNANKVFRRKNDLGTHGTIYTLMASSLGIIPEYTTCML